MDTHRKMDHTTEASLFQREGKSALVVGGGQGMGESTARLLARVGCGVAIVDAVKERADRELGGLDALVTIVGQA